MSPGSSTHSPSGRKRARILSGRFGLSARIACPADTPTAPPLALEEENIVGVEVRADPASRNGVADEQIVEARIRKKGEAAQQHVGGRQMQIDALHEQRPVALRQRAQVGVPERPVRERPATALAQDQARLNVVARGEREQFLRRQQDRESRPLPGGSGAAALPVAPQKTPRSRRPGAQDPWRRL